MSASNRQAAVKLLCDRDNKKVHQLANIHIAFQVILKKSKNRSRKFRAGTPDQADPDASLL